MSKANPSKKINNFKTLQTLEWLETNGLGGYASGTVSGANTRRYHGLLVASMHPPVSRMVLVSKLDETIRIDDKVFELSANQYPGVVHPQGYQHLESFERDLFPVFQYKASEIVLKKTIAAIHGKNTTIILYDVLEAPSEFTFELLPLYSCRSFHSLSGSSESIGHHYLFDNGLFQTMNYMGCPEFFISVPNSIFIEKMDWYYNLEYLVEQYRGLEFKEDLFTHGKFVTKLKKGSTLGIIISTEDPTGVDAFQLFTKEKKRRESIVSDFDYHESLKRLSLAADQFVVKRGKLKTIIAGYHWFSDWGRDTMIALPGLCLVTGRFQDAKNILKAFADSVSDGMLPNRFSDYGEDPEYNTVDATLWFFHAIYKYKSYAKDISFVKALMPVLKNIIEWHYKGTRYSIQVDPNDELLSAGQDNVQLTWMDAKVGDWVVTPRKGKAVEINSLWYNALCMMKSFCNDINDSEGSNFYEHKASLVLKSFNALFWNDQKNYLYDYVDGDNKNDNLRPNQVYAISLPFPLLSKEKSKKVIDTIRNTLLTPKGLRSLSRSNKDYKPIYGGDVWHRDGAYHQGTVWSFLIGTYIDAIIMVDEIRGKEEAKIITGTFFKHLDEACIGSVSEIFDGEPPHTTRGCIAQAWGVAEILRVSIEHNLFPKVSY